MLDRPLPHNTELEEQCLSGSVWLSDKAAVRQLSLSVPDDVFFSPDCRAAWVVVRELVQEQSLDGVSFLNACQARVAGGMEFATKILAKPTTTTRQSLNSWFSSLRELAHYRQIITQSVAALEQAFQQAAKPVEIDREMSERRQTNLTKYQPDLAVSIEDALARFEAFSANLKSEKPKTIGTGISKIDAHGLIPPEYCVILARSSVGKTAWMLSMACQLMLFQKKRVLLWSGEQQIHMIVAKLLSILARTPLSKVIGLGQLWREEAEAIEKMKAEYLPQFPMHLLDGRKSIEAIWGHASQIRDQYGLDAVFLDQLDKITVPKGSRSNREEQLAKVSGLCFDMMQSLDCPVFLLAQLGIKHQKENPNPQMWQIRDCSQVIQDCDRAYVLDRPEAEPDRFAKLGDKAKDFKGKAIVRLEKNRNGIGGLWQEIVEFDRSCGFFHGGVANETAQWAGGQNAEF